MWNERENERESLVHKTVIIHCLKHKFSKKNCAFEILVTHNISTDIDVHKSSFVHFVYRAVD